MRLTTRRRRGVRGGWALLAMLLLGAPGAFAAAPTFTVTMIGPLHTQAAAVGQTSDGTLVGTLVDVYVTLSPASSGQGGSVFLDTHPLMQVDMQGSARMAALVASNYAGIPSTKYDVFYSIRSESSVIGGPSAGALLTVATLAAMTNHTLRTDAVLTGTILPDGSVGPVGGIPEKAQAASAAGKNLFLYPAGQEVVQLSSGAIVDFPTYCHDTLAITCESVSTIDDAFAIMTGYKVTRVFTGTPVTGDESTAILHPGAKQLLANATLLLGEAHRALRNVTIPSPLLPAINASSATGNQTLADANAAYNASQYYTTATKAFQSSIEARFLLYMAGWIQAGGTRAYVNATIDAANVSVNQALDASSSVPPVTIAQLEALGAAQTRAQEAADLIGQARNATSALDALHTAAFAHERAGTVLWWLSIGRDFLSGPSVNETQAAATADQSIESASETLSYAKALENSEGGGTSATSQQAQQLVDRANSEQAQGLPAAALADALEADVRAGLSLASNGVGTIPNESLDRAGAAANQEIVTSRSAGVEPILAVSYLQFANALRNATPPDPNEAYVFFHLARLTARLPQAFALKENATTESRFSPYVSETPILQAPASWLPAYLAIGVVVGALGAVLLLSPRRRS
ncbi:MAG: S16 family serine protease [Thermoplasmatota archaeon]